MGCPIRTLQDHGLVTGSLDFSQVLASFIASRHQVIRHVPLCLVIPTGRRASLLRVCHAYSQFTPTTHKKSRRDHFPALAFAWDKTVVWPASVDRFINLWHYKIISFPTRIQPASCDLADRSAFLTTCSPSTPNHTCVRFRLERHSLSLLTRAPGRESHALRRETASEKSSVGRTIVCIRLARRHLRSRVREEHLLQTGKAVSTLPLPRWQGESLDHQVRRSSDKARLF